MVELLAVGSRRTGGKFLSYGPNYVEDSVADGLPLVKTARGSQGKGKALDFIKPRALCKQGRVF